MIVFATSDKGGTGRSVTVSNVAYRRALDGINVCYLDFDFGSPTAGAIFQLSDVARGVKKRPGTHTYLRGGASDPIQCDIWKQTNRAELDRPRGAGRLVLLPGDEGGGEFARLPGDAARCATLLANLDDEFDLCIVDLSAGRSYATELVLEALTDPALGQVGWRWLVFHRWTRQHIIAANGLVYGERGIIDGGKTIGLDGAALTNAIRFVRTAVVDPDSDQLSGLRAAQVAWLRRCNRELQELAGRHHLGRTNLLGSIPLDPVLQWREQLILDDDVYARQVANRATIEAFIALAGKLAEDARWERL
ncbi:SCO2523 family variant P-loop protein [Cryptosporangium aurantiacum]|uniref:CobQ/CobB/MinD/ParA nucleotide binding domain-containing protein n=1 Tax=Cryptosporangium aurantiacum TaxID=134849 RepID=A0A1M7RJC0_9ACTN|nr:SCO2523 family variant P-loop protein [Cryptosporangium aurantiacum]SHN46397.1 CobQ/CobB/MinD/ParA nucleotide binding domain-containing protein [Cryptosporangium aurantiacum]